MIMDGNNLNYGAVQPATLFFNANERLFDDKIENSFGIDSDGDNNCSILDVTNVSASTGHRCNSLLEKDDETFLRDLFQYEESTISHTDENTEITSLHNKNEPQNNNDIKRTCIESIKLNSTLKSFSNDITTVQTLMAESLKNAMNRSTESQQKIQSWDRKMGLKRCHSKTMCQTTLTRKRLRCI